MKTLSYSKSFVFWTKISITLIAVSALYFSKPIYALELKPSEIRGKTEAAPVSVLQNRFFMKTYRPELGLMAGTMLNEAYSDTAMWGWRIGMFFSEWVGAEVQYLKTRVSDSDDRKALNKMQFRKINEDKIVTPNPEVNNISEIVDVNIVTAPFYGKLNLVDMMIVYTDLFVSAGMSRVDTDQGVKNAISLATGLRLYLLNSWSIRVEFRDRMFQETRAGETDRRNALSVDFGLSYFFF